MLGAIVEDRVCHRARIVAFQVRGTEGTRRTCHSGLIIGADGRGSKISELVGVPPLKSSAQRTATIYGYFPNISNEGYRWHFGDHLSAGAIPTNNGQHAAAGLVCQRLPVSRSRSGLPTLRSVEEPARHRALIRRE